ncbi:MAG: hypothetical protein ABDH37_05755 [Candidatus Hydrothermales bacterium]
MAKAREILVDKNVKKELKDGEHRKIVSVFIHFSEIPWDKNPSKSSVIMSNFWGILKITAEEYDG